MALVLRTVRIDESVDSAVERFVQREFKGNRSKAYSELLSRALELPPITIDPELEKRIAKRVVAMLRQGNQ